MKRICLSVVFALAMLALLGLSVVPSALAQQEPVQNEEQVVHVVQPGENLFRISLRYNTSIEAIMAANGLTDSHTIKAGQQLIIPSGQVSAAAPPATPTEAAPTISMQGDYIVKAGDTLSSIAVRYDIPLWSLMQSNGLTNHIIYVDQRLLIPDNGELQVSTETDSVVHSVASTDAVRPPTYSVQPGDNLTQIARRFGTTVSELAHLNGIANPSAIYAGQVLRLLQAEPGQNGHGKRIVVNLTQQHLYAYEGDQLVFSFVASSGAAPSYTKTGQFFVQSKIPNAYGSAWDIWMPHWLGIYWAGSTENGIHALPILPGGGRLWAGYLGTPISYGCIVLGTWEAEQLYYWADLGTPVTIQY